MMLMPGSFIQNRHSLNEQFLDEHTLTAMHQSSNQRERGKKNGKI